jgi:hypothetical protein
MPNTLMASASLSHLGMYTASRHTLLGTQVDQLPRRGTCFLPQSRMAYATRGYNSHPLRGNPPSSCLSPPPARTDVDTQRGQVPPSSWAAEHSVPYSTGCPTLLLVEGVNDHAQSLTPYRSLLSTSSTFDLFFKVLFTFRSRYFCSIGLVVIFSFRRELPPTLA